MKELAFSSEIKRFVWLQVALNMFFNSLGIITAPGGMLPIMAPTGSVIFDFTLTTILIPFFLFVFGRLELMGYRTKNNIEGLDFDRKNKQHLKILPFATVSPVVAYFKLLIRCAVFITVPVFALVYFLFGEAGSAPVLPMLGLKELLAVIMAMYCAKVGAFVGAFEPASVPNGYVAKPKAAKA